MANTYKLIETKTLSSSASSVVFSSIPQTYTDLHFRVSTRNSNNSNYVAGYLKFNNDTSTRISALMWGNGQPSSTINHSTLSGAFIGDIVGSASGLTLFMSNLEVYIPNYANSSNPYKVYQADSTAMNTAAPAYNEFVVGTWNNSNAITEVAFEFLTGSFVANSVFSLYGINSN